MTLEKVDLSTIGWFSLVTIPYSAKFIWSPLLDSFIPPFLGRRRGWLLITQIGLVLAIGAMSLQNPSKALLMLAINAFMLAFFSATQDIAADAYRTDILLPAERGTGVANFVLGYRLALIITGSLTFILADHLRWPPNIPVANGTNDVNFNDLILGARASISLPTTNKLAPSNYFAFSGFFSASRSA